MKSDLLEQHIYTIIKTGVQYKQNAYNINDILTDYPETTNATGNNKRSWNQQAGIRCKYVSGNNLSRIKLIRGKLFPDTYLLHFTTYWLQ